MSNLPGNAQPPNVREIIQKDFKQGENPLDFVMKNLRTQPSENTVLPNPVQPPIVPATSTPAPALEPHFDSDPNFPIVPEPKKEEPKPQPDPTDSSLEVKKDNEVPLELEEPEVEEGPKKSIKDLRKLANETSRQLQTAQEELQQTKSELERYRTGEAIPEKVKQHEERIAELEHYEQLHAFKSSKAYRKKFTEPLSSLTEQARKVAADYGVDPQVLDQALNIDNKKDQNAFLRKHFDDVGTLEARDVLVKIRDLAAEMDEAEANSKESLVKVENDIRLQDQREAEDRINRLTNVTRSGWMDAIRDLKSSEEFPELSIKENNEEHNKIAKPIIENASRELVSFLKILGEAGITDLPPEAAKVLAKRFLLSQAASVIAQSRSQHYQRAEELLKTSARTSQYVRPPVGGGPVNGTVPKSNNNLMTPEKAANALLDNVLNKR